jgi:pro-apoptotic serine protease NMA111
MVQVAVRQTRSYQSSFAGTYQASAFLVNEELGLLFTAAHAVQGPCEGYIISHNDERVLSSSHPAGSDSNLIFLC